MFTSFVNSFHIYAFTLTSGYIFAYLIIVQGKYEIFFSFLVTKIKRLIVPYIFVCIFWVIPIAWYFYHYNIGEIWNRYVLGTNPNQLWFLLMLFWVFIFAWPQRNVYKKHFFISGIFVIAFYCIGVVGSHFCLNYYFIWTGCEYLFYFWLGFQLYNHFSIVKKVNFIIWDILFMFMFSFQYINIFPRWVLSIFEIILHMVGAIAAFFTFQFVAELVNWKKNKFFGVLSKYTMPIYLFHQQVIYFLLYLLNGKINLYANSIINFVFSMLISIIISFLLMRIKVTRFLIGEK